MGQEKIWLATPHMSDEGYEKAYIAEAFDLNWITTLGKNVHEFEQGLKLYGNAPHITATCSGTAALHLAVLLSGIKPGDLVFAQDLTFAASVNPAACEKANLVFLDSERDTWNLDPAVLEKAIELYGVPKAVIAVDLYGVPAKLGEIAAICKRHGITLIEDAAEALGSTYNGAMCGTFGNYGVWSFNGNKIITTSGGGALISPTAEDAAHALKLATQAREPVAWYEHTEIGYNYRLSNICAGIGRGQLHILDQHVAKKRAIFDYYRENLVNLPLAFLPFPNGTQPNCWLSVALLDKKCSVTPGDVIAALAAENIESRHVWKPMHLQPVFRDCPFVTLGDHSVSGDLFVRGICLPSDVNMTAEQQARVCAVLRRCFEV